MAKKSISTVLAAALLGASMLFTGCATTQLQTQAKMTRSIFIDPVTKEQKTVFVTVKNTSGQDVELESKLIAQLMRKGYKVVDDPDAAKFVLMTNILFANNLREANAARGATTAGAVGAAVGSSGGGKNALAGAVVGAVIGGLVAKATEDDIFRMVVDVVVRQKTKQKVATTTGNTQGQATVSNQARAGFMNEFAGPIKSKDGAGQLNDAMTGQTVQQYQTDYIEKKTRVFAEAVKMNLTLTEAMPILEDKISKSIAGIF